MRRLNENEMREFGRTFLGSNSTLWQYVAESVDHGREAAHIHIQDADLGFSLGVLTNRAGRLMPQEMETLRERLGCTNLSQ
jgi:hypothetical protein